MHGMDGRADDNREWRVRWSLGFLHFLVIAAFTWARIVRDGALLSRVPVEWVPWLTAAVLHGFYDFLLVGFGWIFYPYFIGLVIYVVRLLKKSAREDGPINN